MGEDITLHVKTDGTLLLRKTALKNNYNYVTNIRHFDSFIQLTNQVDLPLIKPYCFLLNNLLVFM